jgi:hypothetical protein
VFPSLDIVTRGKPICLVQVSIIAWNMHNPYNLAIIKAFLFKKNDKCAHSDVDKRPSTFRNKTGNVRIMQHWSAFTKHCSSGKAISVTYLSVCECACAFMWVPGHVGFYMRMCAYSLPYPAFNAYAPYFDVICGPSGSTTFFDTIS